MSETMAPAPPTPNEIIHDPALAERLAAETSAFLEANFLHKPSNKPEAPIEEQLANHLAGVTETYQAAKDWQAYKDSRPTKDAEGRIRDANGKFYNTYNDYEKDDTGYVINKRIEAESLVRDLDSGETKVYEEMGMVELARRLGQAELNEDKTSADNILDVLLAKVDSFATDKNLQPDSHDALFDRLLKAKEAYKAQQVSDTKAAELSAEAPAKENRFANRTRRQKDARDPKIERTSKEVMEYNLPYLQTEAGKLNSALASFKDAQIAGDFKAALAAAKRAIEANDEMDELLNANDERRAKNQTWLEGELGLNSEGVVEIRATEVSEADDPFQAGAHAKKVKQSPSGEQLPPDEAALANQRVNEAVDGILYEPSASDTSPASQNGVFNYEQYETPLSEMSPEQLKSQLAIEQQAFSNLELSSLTNVEDIEQRVIAANRIRAIAKELKKQGALDAETNRQVNEMIDALPHVPQPVVERIELVEPIAQPVVRLTVRQKISRYFNNPENNYKNRKVVAAAIAVGSLLVGGIVGVIVHEDGGSKSVDTSGLTAPTAKPKDAPKPPVDSNSSVKPASGVETNMLDDPSGKGFEDSLQQQFSLNDTQAHEAYQAIRPYVVNQPGTYSVGSDVRIQSAGNFSFNSQAEQALQTYLQSIGKK